MATRGVPMERGSQTLLGAGLAIVGALAAGLPWVLLRSAASEAEEARAQQAYTEGRCTVQLAEQRSWRTQDGEERALRVTFTVHAAGRAVRDVEYQYPRYASPPSLAVGQQLPCFYDPQQPSRAVLLRRAAPAQDGGSPLVLAAGSTLFGVLFLALGLWIALSKTPLRVGGGED